MRRVLCLIVIFFFASAVLVPAAPMLAGPKEYETDEVLVNLLSATDRTVIESAYQLRLIDQFGSRAIFRMQITDGATPKDKVKALERDSRVRFAEPNYIGQTPEARRRSVWGVGGDSSTMAAQWALQRVGLDRAKRAGFTGAGIRIAVLDGGVDPTHPALMGKLLPGYDFVDDDADPREGAADQLGYGHGTHVAGIIAQAAPDAKVIPVRVLNAAGEGNIWVLAEGLAYAVDPDGDPRTDDGAQVINLSLGTTQRTKLLNQIIAESSCEEIKDDTSCKDVGKGTVVVAAAGNDADTTPLYPAGEKRKGLLSVAATTAFDRIADFSNTGSWVTIAAPGDRIISSVPGGYGTWSGTSMAAPFVAATAALLRSADRSLDATKVTERIMDHATALCGTTNDKSKLNRLDAARALGIGTAIAQCQARTFVPMVRK